MTIEEITIAIYCAKITGNQKADVQQCYAQAESAVKFLNEKATDRRLKNEGRTTSSVRSLPQVRG